MRAHFIFIKMKKKLKRTNTKMRILKRKYIIYVRDV